MIDCHCHLDESADLKSAQKCGVKFLITAATNFDDFQKTFNATKNPAVFAVLGVHPFYAENPFEISELAKFLENEKVLGIGEIGLDFSPAHKKSVAAQIAILEKQLALAHDTQKPVVLHCVKSGAALFESLKKYKIRGVLHGFGGSVEEAKNFLKRGFKISFNGNLLKENFKRTRQLAQTLPADSLLLESDFPFASQLLDLPKTLRELVALRGESFENLKTQIFQNSCEIFDFPR